MTFYGSDLKKRSKYPHVVNRRLIKTRTKWRLRRSVLPSYYLQQINPRLLEIFNKGGHQSSVPCCTQANVDMVWYVTRMIVSCPHNVKCIWRICNKCSGYTCIMFTETYLNIFPGSDISYIKWITVNTITTTTQCRQSQLCRNCGSASREYITDWLNIFISSFLTSTE